MIKHFWTTSLRNYPVRYSQFPLKTGTLQLKKLTFSIQNVFFKKKLPTQISVNIFFVFRIYLLCWIANSETINSIVLLRISFTQGVKARTFHHLFESCWKAVPLVFNLQALKYILCKPRDRRVFVQFEIMNVLGPSFRFIWIPMFYGMWWI